MNASSIFLLCCAMLCVLSQSDAFAPPFAVGKGRSLQLSGVRSMRSAEEQMSRRQVLATSAPALIALATPKQARAFQDFDEWKKDRDRRESVRDDEFVVEFGKGPLGLDLQEVRFTSGYTRLMIKAIKPQTQADELQKTTPLQPQVFVKRVNGQLVEGVDGSSALQLIQREKKQLDSEGKPLKLLLSPPELLEKFELKEKMAGGA